MECRTNKSQFTDAEFKIFIKKRLNLNQGWKSCEELTEFALECFKLGIEYSRSWIHVYLTTPQEGSRVILRVNNRQIHICDYRDGIFYRVYDGKVINIDSNSEYQYLNYPIELK